MSFNLVSSFSFQQLLCKYCTMQLQVEEDEDAKAWQAMMLEMTGEKPQETQIVLQRQITAGAARR